MHTESLQQQFERFYFSHHDRVAAYLLSRTDRDSAQDALARTFEVAWRRFEDVPAQELPWLLGVASKTLAAQRRAQGRRNALVERISAEPALPGPGQLERFVQREALRHALAALSEREREAILLLAWDGLTQQEAATVLGCSRVAVAVRVHRARRRLAAALSTEPLSNAGAADRDDAPGAPPNGLIEEVR